MPIRGHRLTFLIVEAEPAQGLSTRKLLLESAKHNVITAYSSEEGLQMFKRFPQVDAIVIDGELKGNSRLAKQVREVNPDIRIICLSSRKEQERIGRTKRQIHMTLPNS